MNSNGHPGFTLDSEFARVHVWLDLGSNGPRLGLEDLNTGRISYLDPLELESLAWMPHRGLTYIVDPSGSRWRSADDLDASEF